MTTLAPVQQRAYEELLGIVSPGVCATLVAGPGAGKTTILREVNMIAGGAWLGAADLVEAASVDHPLALEEAFHRRVSEALEAHETVIVDDFHLLAAVVGGMGHLYPRQ